MLPKFLIIFLFFLNIASNEEVPISWHETKKLTWADFKGSVEINSDAVAVTASGITFSFSVKQSNDTFISFEAHANAHFYPEKSWYLQDKGDDHILAHEQLHFDITELHVRRLRYNISKVKISQHIKQDLRQLHEEANLQLAKMQYDYDTRSENSMNVEQQTIWSHFVKDELKKFRVYRSK